ncbi:PAS domain S-box protein [Azospirillum sp.]|uniref:PAS domain S-box protein n=1 Tax=Azospirillum sp. TaxID=34012 RepID=UPI003D73455B
MLLVVLVLVPAAVIEIGNEFELRTAREAEVHQTTERLAGLIEAEQGRIAEGVRQVLLTLGRTAAVRGGDDERCQDLLDRLGADYPAHMAVHIAGPTGVIRCATDAAAVGFSIADRPHFRMALEHNGFVVGEHLRQRTTGLPALPFALPFRDAKGQDGVATALLDLGWLKSYVAGKPLPDGALLLVADRNGSLLARVPEIGGAVGSPLPEPFRDLLRAGAPGTVELTGSDGVTRVVAFRPAAAGIDGLFIAVGIDKQAATAPMRAAMHRALAVIGGVALLTLAAAWWGADCFVYRPLGALADAARRWRVGDLSARTGISDGSEIGQLARAFDAMAEDLQHQTTVREQANALAHKMAAVLASTTDGVFEVDRGWRITFVNDRARALIAGDRELVGQRLWDSFPEAVGSVFSREYERAMAEQAPVEFEGFYPPLGAWFAVRAFPSQGGLAVFFQDITARKQADAALQAATREKSELLARHDALLAHAPVGFAFFDGARRCIGVNPELARLTGRDAGVLIGQPVEAVLPDNALALAPVIERVFASGEAAQTHEIVGLGDAVGEELGEGPDGGRRHWLANVYPVREEGAVTAVGVVVMEVTELREAEAARRCSDERARSVFAQAAVGLERVALDGRILEANDKLGAILGCAPEEIAGRSFRDLTHPDDRAAEEALLDHLLVGDIPSYAVEKRYLRKDGSPVWVRVTSSLARITGTEEAYRISVVEDIGERKAAEAALHRAKEEAERADLAKTKFLAAASHDLRQPLQSLFFFTAALGAQVTPKGTEVLRNLERGLDALKGLLDSLLDVSRLDAGLVVPEIEDFPVSDVLDEIGAATAPVAAARGLLWRVAPCTAVVRSDRTLLSRMLRNLVENAVRYTADGAVALECRVETDALTLTVRDSGIGIPPDQLERIWEEFHQVGNPERDRTQGLGLGLAIVRRLSDLLGHPVEVRSEVGRGSAFRIRVPLGAAIARPASATPAEPPASGEGRFAVLVDDDAIVLMGLQAILTEWGYDVLIAGSADQVVERLEADGRRPDIVVADYRLREGRVGTEAILRVRDLRGADIPGVILTGETGPECQHDAALHHFTVVHKPVTPRELGAALERQMHAAE